MKANEIVEILESEANTWIGSKTLLVNGSWGVGKSYYLKQFIKNTKENNKDILTIYLSLFGKTSAAQLNEELYQHFSSNLSSFKKVAKKILSAISDTIPSMFKGIALPDLSQIISNDSFINKRYKDKKFILIFDDLERLEYSLYREVLGYIENLSNNKNLLTIIAANEQKIYDIDKNFLYQNYKEKMIFKSFVITKPADEAIKTILKDYQKYFQANVEVTNIRTVKKAVEKFDHINQICEELKEDIKLEMFKHIFPLILYLFICIEEHSNALKDDKKLNNIKNNVYKNTTAQAFSGIFYNSDELLSDLVSYLEVESKDFLIDILNKLAIETEYHLQYQNFIYLNDETKKQQVNSLIAKVFDDSYEFAPSLKIINEVLSYNSDYQLGIKMEEQIIINFLVNKYRQEEGDKPFSKVPYATNHQIVNDFLNRLYLAINNDILNCYFNILAKDFQAKNYPALINTLTQLKSFTYAKNSYTKVEKAFVDNGFYINYEFQTNIDSNLWLYYQTLVDFIYNYSEKLLFPKLISKFNLILTDNRADFSDKQRIKELISDYEKIVAQVS